MLTITRMAPCAAASPATNRSGFVSSKRRTSFVPFAGGSGSQANRFFILGTGFVGRYVACRLLEEGWQVSGTCRSSAKKKELDCLGVKPYIFSTEESLLRSLPSLQYATHLLISIPHVIGRGDSGISVRLPHSNSLYPITTSWVPIKMGNFSIPTYPINSLILNLMQCYSIHENLSLLSSGCLKWLCYLSSTSVYGDCRGAWVDEDYPLNPQKEASRLRVKEEQAWLALAKALGIAGYIFRLGGIYGPGRSALDTIRKSEFMLRTQKMRESRQYTARIHVSDIYQAIKSTLSRTSPGIYNIVDDDPASRAEVFYYARSLIAKRWPEKAARLLLYPEDDTRDQGGEISGEKRVSNARMKDKLGVQLIHPSYKTGLQSILDSWEHFPELE